PLHFENYLICLLLFHNPYFRYFSHKENSTEDDTGNNPFGQVISSYNNSYSRQHDDSISLRCLHNIPEGRPVRGTNTNHNHNPDKHRHRDLANYIPEDKN